MKRKARTASTRRAFDRAVDAVFEDIGVVRLALESRRLSERRVHEVRKALKHARACVRLLRFSLGQRGFARCNVSLRDAARPLAAPRDASVLVATLDSLIERGETDAFAREARRFRSALASERTRLSRGLLPSKPSLGAVHACLARLESQAGSWSAGAHTPELEAALRRVYARGRRALAVLKRRPNSDERLHELRKQAKYLWNMLALLERENTTQLAKQNTRAGHLSELLGDDHDLATLEVRAHAAANGIGSAQRALDHVIARHRKRLQRKALARAARLYARGPKAFSARVFAELAKAK